MIDIAIQSKEFERASRLLKNLPGGIEQATSSALNRTLTSVRAKAVKEITRTYDIKSKTVRDSLNIQKSNVNTLSGQIISRGSPIPLINFKVNPKAPSPKRKKQTFVSVKKSGASLSGAFIAEMPNGHIGVYERIGKRRYPIKQLYGPSAPQMMGESNVIENIQIEANKILRERLEHETIRLLGRY